MHGYYNYYTLLLVAMMIIIVITAKATFRAMPVFWMVNVYMLATFQFQL